jgi:hypothetical protein
MIFNIKENKNKTRKRILIKRLNERLKNKEKDLTLNILKDLKAKYFKQNFQILFVWTSLVYYSFESYIQLN